MGYNFATNIMLFGWVLVVLGLFAVLPSRRAAVASMVAGWMLLPEAVIETVGLPELSKMFVAGVSVLIWTFFFDLTKLLAFRPRWFDLPMLLWILCPIPTSVQNGLGMWDGFSTAIGHMLFWGLPYFVGRVYFTDLQSTKDLAIGIFLGALVYVLPSLWEMRMSPQLHQNLYGFRPTSFGMTNRGGGYRPQVFMQHGLMAAAWMAAGTMIGYWLIRTKAVRMIWGIPMIWLWVPVALTFLLYNSKGALILGLLSIAVLEACRAFKVRWPVLAVLALFPIYIFIRSSGMYDGQSAVAAADSLFGGERAQSLEFRITNENYFIEHWEKEPLLGWGGWGRNFPTDPLGKMRTVDGMWVIAMSKNGLIGIITLGITLLLPIVLFVTHCDRRVWVHPSVAPATALAGVLVMYTLDLLPNAMLNPVYTMAAGGLAVLSVDVLGQIEVRGKRRIDEPLAFDEDEDGDEMVTVVDELEGLNPTPHTPAPLG